MILKPSKRSEGRERKRKKGEPVRTETSGGAARYFTNYERVGERLAGWGIRSMPRGLFDARFEYRISAKPASFQLSDLADEKKFRSNDFCATEYFHTIRGVIF